MGTTTNETKTTLLLDEQKLSIDCDFSINTEAVFEWQTIVIECVFFGVGNDSYVFHLLHDNGGGDRTVLMETVWKEFSYTTIGEDFENRIMYTPDRMNRRINVKLIKVSEQDDAEYWASLRRGTLSAESARIRISLSAVSTTKRIFPKKGG